MLDSADLSVALGAAIAVFISVPLVARIRRVLSDSIVGALSPGKVSEYTNATRFLQGFLLVCIVFAIVILLIYRDSLPGLRDHIVIGVALYLLMVGGMLAGTIKKNYEKTKSLTKGPEVEELWPPIILSPLAFFPVWLSKTDEKLAAAFYAAFLNGFFGEELVSALKPPTP